MKRGEFSVSHRIAGLLKEVKKLQPARFRLRKKVLDVAHAKNIEIVSPSFTFQRKQAQDVRIIPPVKRVGSDSDKKEIHVHGIFDQAEITERDDLLKQH